MPVTKSAIKKLRRDIKKTKENKSFERKVVSTFKTALKEKSASLIKLSASLLDKAVRKNLIHKNKAARLKSKLTKKTGNKVKEDSKQPVKSTKSKTAKSARKK